MKYIYRRKVLELDFSHYSKRSLMVVRYNQKELVVIPLLTIETFQRDVVTRLDP